MSTQTPNQETEFRLYEGEQRRVIANSPLVYKYIAGDNDKDKPLVAFVPGMAHNARISYGGHEGYHSKDFLAHWFHERGYGFLGISYPLEVETPMMPAASPNFTIPEWGLQTAVAITNIIQENGLGSEVIVLGWSMAGKIMQPLTVQLARLGMKVVLFVSLAATPALPGLSKPIPRDELEITVSGYANKPALKPVFLTQLEEQDKSDKSHAPRHLIEPAVYEKEYTGATPIGITGYGFRYDSDTKNFVEVLDKWQLMEDGQIQNYQTLPTIAAIYPTSGLDIRHALTDKATWTFLMNQQVMARCYQNGIAAAYCPDSKINTAAGFSARQSYFRTLREIIHGIPDYMTSGIAGTHFFFLGEAGAKRTVDMTLRFLQHSKQTDMYLGWLCDMHRVITETTQRRGNSL